MTALMWRVAYLRPGALVERRDDHDSEALAEAHAAVLMGEGLRAVVYRVDVEEASA